MNFYIATLTTMRQMSSNYMMKSLADITLIQIKLIKEKLFRVVNWLLYMYIRNKWINV